jgi:hypothetical protein
MLLDKVPGTVLASFYTRYMAQYWHVVRQGTWHRTGMFLDKVHGTVLAYY